MVGSWWFVVCSLWLSVHRSVDSASSIFPCHSIHRSDLLSLEVSWLVGWLVSWLVSWLVVLSRGGRLRVSWRCLVVSR